MDRRERDFDPEETLRAAFGGMQAGVWTAMPGIVKSYDVDKQTADVQPAIMGQQRSNDQFGTITLVKMPLLVDCPVQFPSGGGLSLTFPVIAGDECLVVFASRCIDAWWQNGGVAPPAEFRMHDLSDGFALLGFRSVPRALADVSTTSVQLRTDEGTAYVEVDQDKKVTLFGDNVKVHAAESYSWDVDGYGTKVTSTGGSSYQVDLYILGASVTTNEHPIEPPEAP